MKGWGVRAARRRHCATLLATLLVSACDKQAAWGDATSIIVAASPDLWSRVADTVQAALEPRVHTVRDERIFQLTYQDPAEAAWGNLRRFKQLLLIGSPEEAWLAPALNGLPSAPEPPALLQLHDVWARDQLVTWLVLPRGGAADAVPGLLSELQALYERQFRDWAVARMFLTGGNAALADTLRQDAGFELILPAVYEWRRQDSVYVFRNDNPDPSQLIREVVVTWRSPIPSAVSAEDLVAWRGQLAQAYYAYPQVVDSAQLEAGSLQLGGSAARGVSGVWSNPPASGWPAAGPFLLRAVPCPAQDRLYLLDGWLYAPGREKYEFVIQLETLIDSFRCGGGPA